MKVWRVVGPAAGAELLAHAREHLAFWQTVRAQARVTTWGAPLPPGALGEDLILEGITEDRLWIGDRLQLPHCVLAVTAPRLPDAAFAASMGFTQAGRLMAQSGYCGVRLAVVVPGPIEAGDTIELLPGPREVNLRELFRSRVKG